MFTDRGNEMSRITVLGARGSLPVSGQRYREFGGATACVLLQMKEDTFLLDAGSGLLNLEYAVWENRALHIFLSHFHLDHMMGLLLSEALFTPGQKVHFYTADPDADIYAILNGMMQKPYWPVDAGYFKADIICHNLSMRKQLIKGTNTKVQAFELDHPDRAFAYRFWNGGESVVYATDGEFSLESEHGQTQYRNFIKFAKGANAVILDAQYTQEEYESKKGYGHTSMEMAKQIALELREGQTLMFHHAPDKLDRHLLKIERAILKDIPNIYFAKEGEYYPL